MPYRLIRDDITHFEGDAIVCPTDCLYSGGGGTDLAVHLAAGDGLDAACAQLPPLKVGTAAMTPGFGLKAKHVIHTVGPVWQGGSAGEENDLRKAYQSCLAIARQNGFHTMAFPLISSGTFGFPKDKVLRIALDEISAFLLDYEMMVHIVLFSKDAYEIGKHITDDIDEMISDGVPDFHAMEPLSEQMPRSTVPRRRPRRRNAEEAGMLVDACREVERPQQSEAVTGPVHAKKAMPSFVAEDVAFSERLLQIMDEKGMKPSQVYHKANISKQVFSKITSYRTKYVPGKATAVSLCLALELSMEETDDILARLGIVLNRYYLFDQIIRYFIEQGIYDVILINETLYKYDQQLLGSGMN